MKPWIVYLILIFLPAWIFPADWAKKGFKENSPVPWNGKSKTEIQDAQGKSFFLITSSEIDEKRMNQILQLRDIFTHWQGLEIKQLSFTVNADNLEIWILPSVFQTSKGNIASYMPSGMIFYAADAVYYDFRMVKDNVFFKIRGNYLSLDSLISQIHKAMDNPLAYIRLYDPDYYLVKMDEYGRDVEKLKAQMEEQQKGLDLLRGAVMYFQNSGFLSGNAQVSKTALDRLVFLKKGNPKLSKKDAASQLEKEGIKISDREIELIFAVYFNQFE